MTNEWKVAFLGLGSNVGDRERWLAEAVRRLDERPDVRVAARSPIYETDPVGLTDQPAFLNMAVRIETSLPPESLLQATMGIERELGRVRTVRWGPRTIDIDILLYDDDSVQTPSLTIPHPRLAERAFVLVPLFDVLTENERGWRPGFREPAVEAIGVKRWINSKWPGESEPSGN